MVNQASREEVYLLLSTILVVWAQTVSLYYILENIPALGGGGGLLQATLVFFNELWCYSHTVFFLLLLLFEEKSRFLLFQIKKQKKQNRHPQETSNNLKHNTSAGHFCFFPPARQAAKLPPTVTHSLCKSRQLQKTLIPEATNPEFHSLLGSLSAELPHAMAI